MKSGFALALALSFSGSALAATQITRIDFDTVEVRVGNDYQDMDKASLGPTPIKIIAQDEQNFLKIKTPDGKKVWVNGSDVTTERFESIQVCQGLTSSQSGDRRMYGGRGQGEACK